MKRALLLAAILALAAPSALADVTSVRQGAADWTCYDSDGKTIISQNSREDTVIASCANASAKAGGKDVYIQSARYKINNVPPAATAPTPSPQPAPSPSPQVILQFTAAIGGTYAALNGATISAPINVRLSSSAASLSPCVFSLDGIDRNTEYGAPYDVDGDDILVTYAPGAHVLQAKCTSLSISATFAVTAAPVPPSGSGSATLSWYWTPEVPAPADLAGYRIEYGLVPGVRSNSIAIASAAITSYVVAGLGSGTWEFGIRSVTSSGVSSDLSNLVRKSL